MSTRARVLVALASAAIGVVLVVASPPRPFRGIGAGLIGSGFAQLLLRGRARGAQRRRIVVIAVAGGAWFVLAGLAAVALTPRHSTARHVAAYLWLVPVLAWLAVLWRAAVTGQR